VNQIARRAVKVLLHPLLFVFRFSHRPAYLTTYLVQNATGCVSAFEFTVSRLITNRNYQGLRARTVYVHFWRKKVFFTIEPLIGIGFW